MSENKLVKVADLPGGYELHREPNEVGGYRYWDNSIDIGVVVWDTALISEAALFAALLDQQKLRYNEQTKDSMMLKRPLSDLMLTVRPRKALRDELGVKTIGDLVKHSESDLIKLRNFGKKSLQEVRDKLAAIGLELRIGPVKSSLGCKAL